MKASNLRLYHKGLVLIGFPLVCQTLFVALLLSMLLVEQHHTARADHAKVVINKAHQITSDMGNLFAQNAFPDETNQTVSTARAQEQLRHAFKQVDDLRETIENEPSQRENAEALKRISKNSLAIFSRFAGEDAKKMETLRQVYVDQACFDAFRSYFDIHKKIIAVEARGQNQRPVEIQAFRNALRIFLLAMVVMSIGLAVVLAKYYIRAIREPLNHLSANAQSISKQSPLPPTIKGNDEFASLDRLFHSVDKALHEARSRELALIANAADLICSMDRDGIFYTVNPFSERMLGYSEDELLRKSVLEIATAEDISRLDEQLKKFSDEKASQGMEVALRTKQGDKIDTLWSTFWSQLDEKLFCVIHNVSERKSLERFKQDLFNMISHDLRTPLTSVSGRIEMLQMGHAGAMPADADAELSMVMRNIKDILFLIDNLLDFERLRDGTVPYLQEECDLDEVSQIVVENLSIKAKERKVEISVECDENASCYCDAKMLRQSMENLCTNSLRNAPAEKTVTIEIAKEDGWAIVSIKDNWSGKLAEMGENVYSVFDRLSVEESDFSSAEALSLAVSKLCVEFNGGKIGIEKNGDEGALFWFRLPEKPNA